MPFENIEKNERKENNQFSESEVTEIQLGVFLYVEIVYIPSFEKTSTSHKLKLPSTPTNCIATNWPTNGRAHKNVFVVPSSKQKCVDKQKVIESINRWTLKWTNYFWFVFVCRTGLPTVPGYQAHNGFRCRSKLLLPTRISTSCNGGFPQQPRVVIRTTRTVCGARRSTFHQGDASFCVSEHFCSSGFSLPNLPSFPKLAGPARVDDDWFAGFRYATFVPVHKTIIKHISVLIRIIFVLYLISFFFIQWRTDLTFLRLEQRTVFVHSMENWFFFFLFLLQIVDTDFLYVNESHLTNLRTRRCVML